MNYTELIDLIAEELATVVTSNVKSGKDLTNGQFIEAAFPNFKFTRVESYMYINFNERNYSFCPAEFWDSKYEPVKEEAAC